MFYSVISRWGYNYDDVEVVLATDSEAKAVEKAIQELENGTAESDVLIQSFAKDGTDVSPKQMSGFSAYHIWFNQTKLDELKCKLAKLKNHH